MLGAPDRPPLGRGAVLLAMLVALGVAAVLDQRSPFPAADVRRGSEEAFTSGLEPREIEGGIVRRRWAGETLTAEFERLPKGPLRVELVVRGHHHDVKVSVAGVMVGVIPPGRSRGDYDLPEPRDGRLQVSLEADAFEARGRRLGFMLERLVVRHGTGRRLPPWPLALLFLGPALATAVCARLVLLSPVAAGALAIGTSLAQAAVLWPEGLVRSPYAARLALLLVLGALGAVLGARGGRGATPGDARFGFPALLLAFWVQGLLATHPMLVTSDAVFHANKVRSAAEGEYFPLSRTPHDPPYVFPYGVTFHLLLVPLHRAGADLGATVVSAAALAGLGASVALYRTLRPSGAARAAAVVALLQLLPVTFGPLSAGNCSNVFAQALSLLFLLWDERGRPGGWPLGASFLLLSATAHFGVFLVLLALVPVLVWMRTRARADRTLVLAAAIGLGGAALYYLQFLGAMTPQFSRLAGGGGGGRDLLAAALHQARAALNEWGWPAALACALAVVGVRTRALEPLFARALCLATALLALLAVLTPLEVRYLYAAAPAAALLATDGLRWLRERRGGAAWVAALVLAQSVVAVQGMAHALLRAYRP